MTDAAQSVEIEISPGKLLKLLGVGVVMTVLPVALTFIPDFRAEFGVIGTVLACAISALFAFFALIGAWRLFTTRGPVVTITPDGIRDTRVAAELIPWSAVRSISTWEMANQRVMVVAVDPALERTLTLTPMARWSRSANRALGADGLCITAAGLKIDYETLLVTALRYAAQGNPHVIVGDL